jgi:4a-hydroxytetrahydrobiopterin dehydratase
LSEEQIAEGLVGLPAWRLQDGKLHREFRFANFSEAFAFMTRVALEAEKRDHHPDWSNVYNRVVVDLQTHDAGGVSQKDIDFAAAIDQITETG